MKLSKAIEILREICDDLYDGLYLEKRRNEPIPPEEEEALAVIRDFFNELQDKLKQ